MKNQLRWDNLTSAELGALAEQNAVVLVPLGSTEQHGPHLPTGSDSLLSTWIAEATAAELRAQGVPVVVAPTVTIGNSLHHINFPGTLSLEPGLYQQYLFNYCQCLVEHGFERVAFINGHGGNRAPTETALIDITTRLGLAACYLMYTAGSEAALREILTEQDGIHHACEGETSMMLACDESLVDPCYKSTKGGNIQKGVMRHKGPARFRYWDTVSPIGALGNSYAATKEKGERIKAAFAANLARQLADPALWPQPEKEGA